MSATTDRSEVLSAEYNPFASPQLEDPYEIWRSARDDAPAFFSQVLGVWIVTRYEDVSWVLSDDETFSSMGGTRPFSEPPPEVAKVLATVPDAQDMDVLTSDPPRHARLRGFMQKAFTARRVAGLEDGLRDLANQLVDAVYDDGSCDFYTEFAHPFPLYAIGQLIGLSRSELAPVPQYVTSNLQLKWGSLDPEAHLRAAEGRVAFYQFGLDLIAERRANPGTDLLSALVRDSDASEDPLTEPELVGQVMTLLTAGHETTANWLTLALRNLLEVPARWAALCADPSTSPAVVEETLRFEGPAQGLWRTAKRDVVVGGVTIPAGARIQAVVGAANRDERKFANPAQYDTARPDVRTHLQFGRGIHTCVGAGLARIEGRVAFEVLARRLDGLRLRNDGEIFFAPNAIQRVPRRLLVEWDVR